MTQPKISVLIVDDSAVNRKFISDIVNSSSRLNVVGTAPNGKLAISKLEKNNADVIILDLEMPVMDGIAFLERKKAIDNKVPVVVFSSSPSKTNEALSKGASDFIVKPKDKDQCEVIREELIASLLSYGYNHLKNKMIAGMSSNIEQNKEKNETNLEDKKLFFEQVKSKINVRNNEFNISKIINEKDLLKLKLRKFDMVVIGISTGGPGALKNMLPEIPVNFPIPMIIVQHMPEGFTNEFAKGLNNVSNLIVKEIEDKEIPKKGYIYISPGGSHTRINKINNDYIMEIFDGKNVNGHKPSVGVLFDSVAKNIKEKTIAIIMTGMGNDGSHEIGKIRKSGGLTIAQDNYSSVVFGMPKIAIEENNIDYIVSLSHMVKLLNAILIG